MTRQIVVTIVYEEDHLPPLLHEWGPPERWTTPEIALLLQDGDGGPAWVIHVEDAGEV